MDELTEKQRKELVIECQFRKNKYGRLVCIKHNQSLLYYYPPIHICQIEEDRIISALGGIDNYNKWIAELTRRR